ncbi:hypothetical protein U9M48_007778 [Paspalum notatum var. saurae]|uniref:Uncharacterized protein n=1 Tax=Paspalum notatum var. saurae TaxID=547442 RepID=A0AAQ3WC24_PASNO
MEGKGGGWCSGEALLESGCRREWSLVIMSNEQYARHIQRRRRNRRRGIRDERGEFLRGASSVGAGGGNVTFLDDDDDDFMPVHGQATTQSARGAGRRSTSSRADSISPRTLVRYLVEDNADSLSMRGQAGHQEVGPGPRRSTSRPAAASSSRRSNVNFVDDDDDDFIPMRGQVDRREHGFAAQPLSSPFLPSPFWLHSKGGVKILTVTLGEG